MEEFKKVFQKMAISYVEYVQKKIDECKTQTTTNDDANNMSITLMNEVRTANVVAVTLTRMNQQENEEHTVTVYGTVNSVPIHLNQLDNRELYYLSDSDQGVI